MANRRNYKAHLNPQQLQAAEAMGLVSVCAGAGTGKTATQTASIIDKIEAQGIDPERIIALTFTNKASREMRDRIRSFGVTPPAFLGTFHSVCIKLLRRYPELGGGINIAKLNILDPEHAIPFVIQHIVSRVPDSAYEKLTAMHRKGAFRNTSVLSPKLMAEGFIYFLSTMHAEGLTLEDIQSHDHLTSLGDRARLTIAASAHNPVGYVMARKLGNTYAKVKAASDTMDFDDLISIPVRSLSQNPALQELIADSFDAVFVDEDQDTNVPQDMLVRFLAAKAKCFFRVGDVRQGIYGWRGSRADLLLAHARKAEEHGTVVYLSQNYRSTQPILDMATSVLTHDSMSPKDGLIASRPGATNSPLPVFMTEYESDQTEIRHIVQSIVSRVRRGESPGRFAVITRTNQTASAFYLRLLAFKVPVSCDAVELFRTLVIRFIVAYAMFLTEPENPLNVMRIDDLFANSYAPEWSMGDKNRGDLQKAIGKTGNAIEGLRLYLSEANPRYLTKVGPVIESFLKEREALESFTPGPGNPNPYGNAKQVFTIADQAGGITEGIHKRLLNVRGILKDYSEEGRNTARYANDMSKLEKEQNMLEEVNERFNTFLEATEDLSIRDAIEAVTLGSQKDEKNEEQETIRVMTIHKSKGLEFDVVFLPHLTPGSLFRDNPKGSPEYEEAVRCLYVGMTRAREELRMSVPKSVRGFDTGNFPSALRHMLNHEHVHHYGETNGGLYRIYEEDPRPSDSDEEDWDDGDI